MSVPRRQSTLKKLEKLSDELDTAKHASEATTKEVQHARRTSQNVKRDVRLQLHTERKRKRSKDRHTKDSKSSAAVELGRKGGAARARSLTPKKRSALAMKAANIRWNSL